jgi:RFX DNA-binding domain
MLKSVFIESMNQPITNWLSLNYVASKDTSIPRCLIYQHYCEDFRKEGIEPLNTAMFGKVIKMAFPFIKSRRLGNRGNSKYHYFGVAPRNSAVQVHISIEESENEKKFIKEYKALHEKVFGCLVEGDFPEAYREMKVFWGSAERHLSLTKNLMATCLATEKDFFVKVKRAFFRAGAGVDEQKLFAIKETAKNLVLMIKNSVAANANKFSQARIDSYMKHLSGMNSLANLHRMVRVLQKEYQDRPRVEEALDSFGGKTYLFRESAGVGKSALLHEDALALLSHYCASPSFDEFLQTLDDFVFSTILRKEKFSAEEISSQFTHFLLESLCICRSSPRSLSVLCAFFVEYFKVLFSSLVQGSVFRQLEAPVQSEGKRQKECRSFVSQIITQ